MTDGRQASGVPTWAASAAVALALATLAALVRLALGPLPVDDAYITFRYARNLAEGVGLVYNPGEAVLGTTAPLLALVLGGLARVLGPDRIPQLALTLNAGADALSVLLAVHLVRRFSTSTMLAILAGLVLGLSPLLVRYSIGGMETSLVAAIFLGSTTAYLHHRKVVAVGLAAIAIGLRPDAVAIGAGLVATEFWVRRRLPVGWIAALGAAVALEALLLTLTYGVPVPSSLLAKASGIYHIEPLTNFWQFVYLFSGLTLTGVGGFGARGLAVSPNPALNALAVGLLVPQLILAVRGARRLLRLTPRALPLVLNPIIYGLVYSILGLRGSLLAEWYLVAVAPPWVILLFLGLDEPSRSGPGRLRWVFGKVVALVLLSLTLMAYAPQGRGGWRPQNVWTEREELYLAAGALLNERLAPGAVVAASEVGAIGYACRCRIVDTVGLVSPEVVRHYPVRRDLVVGNYAIPPDLIRTVQPDYLVSLEVFLRLSLTTDPWFQSNYRLVEHQPTSVFDSRGLLIYERIKPPAAGLAPVDAPG